MNYYKYIKHVVMELRNNYSLNIKTVNLILDKSEIYRIYTKGPHLLLSTPIEKTSQHLYTFYRKKILNEKNI